jgi:hypothetical protein
VRRGRAGRVAIPHERVGLELEPGLGAHAVGQIVEGEGEHGGIGVPGERAEFPPVPQAGALFVVLGRFTAGILLGEQHGVRGAVRDIRGDAGRPLVSSEAHLRVDDRPAEDMKVAGVGAGGPLETINGIVIGIALRTGVGGTDIGTDHISVERTGGATAGRSAVRGLVGPGVLSERVGSGDLGAFIEFVLLDEGQEVEKQGAPAGGSGAPVRGIPAAGRR